MTTPPVPYNLLKDIDEIIAERKARRERISKQNAPFKGKINGYDYSQKLPPGIVIKVMSGNGEAVLFTANVDTTLNAAEALSLYYNLKEAEKLL